MKAQQRWYHLRQFRKISPYSGNELHALLASELGFRGRHRLRKNWIVVALSMITFFVGITAVAKVPTGGELTDIFAILSKANEDELSDKIVDHKHIQVADLAKSDFGGTKGLVADRSNASPISVGAMFNTAPAFSASQNDSSSSLNPNCASLPSQPIPATRTALSPEAQLELEFWRPVARWNDVGLYESYLRLYPSGTFSDIANAKIKAFRKVAKAGSTTKNKKSISSSESKKPKKTIWGVLTAAIATTEGRCRGGNTDLGAAGGNKYPRKMGTIQQERRCGAQ
jgi:hypothetical protein